MSSTRDTIHQCAFAAILIVGFFVRFLISPAEGLGYDIDINQGWGESAVKLGLAQSYVELVDGNMLPNYAPFGIMIFAAMGHVQHFLFPGDFDLDSISYRVLIKLPAIFADLVTAVGLFLLLRRWRGMSAGLLGAAVASFHPAAIYESAVWGQTDSIYSCFLVLGLCAFLSKRMFLAGIFVALAVLSKMQAVFLLPVFFVLFVRSGWKSFLWATVGGLITTAIISIPFVVGGTFNAVIDVYLNSVGYYSIVSSIAYNFWWSLYGDVAGSMDDNALLFGFLSFRRIGLLLFGLSYLYALWVGWPSLRLQNGLRSLPGIFGVSAFLALAFFLWNTQMHERYLFPFVPLGIPLLFAGGHATFIYWSVSMLFFMNLMGFLPAGSVDQALYTEFPMLDVLIGALQTVLFFHLAAFLWQSHKASLAQFGSLLSHAKRLRFLLPRRR